MAEQEKKGSHKKGANSRRCANYQDRNRLEKNKLKRILQSNGVAAALAWAKEHNTTAMLKSMM